MGSGPTRGEHALRAIDPDRAPRALGLRGEAAQDEPAARAKIDQPPARRRVGEAQRDVDRMCLQALLAAVARRLTVPGLGG